MLETIKVHKMNSFPVIRTYTDMKLRFLYESFSVVISVYILHVCFSMAFYLLEVRVYILNRPSFDA